MPTAFDQAFRRVKELVADFRANEKFYLSPAYQEQEARRDFIDKFWLALGWDVNHDTQKNPLEQEVKVERKEHSNSQRRADYAFYLHPNYRDVRFYVEAKKPHGDIATADNYFQINRYGWSGKTKISILHDFEQFEIVDCRLEPNIDKALSRNVRKYKYTDYEDAEKFAEIYWIFSHEAVANGSLEKFIATLPKRRARDVEPSEIDDSFLKMLDQLRDELARLFKNKNPKLDGDCLTEITQRTLDRFVFTRFLEDKFIEPQRIISTFGSKGSAWDDFITASRRLDKIYNGVVYKHNDWLDEKVKIDDDAFAEICRRFSHVNSPYDFNEIPIHILGSIYERFLGKVIVTTDKRARLEEKPEVRKAGGVYYTPEYIVRYIVENTVGKLIEGKTPAQIAEMRFADIACGSGSFLLGVYDLLIRHHTRYYNENRDRAKIAGKVKKEHKADVEEREDGLHLTLYKKREILLANIYGVDIDPQAVEVAQLSLYLKLLQDETPGSARQYYLDFEQQALLPKLDKNIVCGNSLIGTDILTGQLFASDAEKKLNPMDFEQRFPHIFKTSGGALRETAAPLDFTFPGVPLHGAFSYKTKKGAKATPHVVPEFEGGFDAIIGNPPYVNAWDFFENQPVARKFINDGSHFETADRHWDLYVLFLERAYKLTKTGGRFSFIIPFSYAIQKYAIPSRRLLLQRTTVESIADIRSVRVFGEVPVITIVPVFVHRDPPKSNDIQILKPSAASTRTSVAAFENSHVVSQEQMLMQHESMLRLDLSKEAAKLVAKMELGSVKLGDLCYVNYGAQMSSKEKGGFGKEHVIRDSKKNKHCRKMIGGRELYRYQINWEGRFVDWSFAPTMYGPRWPEFFELQKIMIRDITGTHRIEATFDTEGFYCDHTVLCALRNCDVEKWKPAEPAAIEKSKTFHPAFLTGVIASRCVSAYYYLVLTGEGVRTGGGFHTYPETIRNFPIPLLDFSKPADKARHDRMVELVEQMLATRKQLAGAQSDKDKDFYTNRCDGLDRQIDTLVYDLYALTPAEIKIVEGAAKCS